MTALRRDAMDLLEKIPEDKLCYIVQFMQGLSGSYGAEDHLAKDTAFEGLESLRRKAPDLNCEKELETYRESKYGSSDIS